MSVPEATVDYLGYAVSIAGLPLPTKAVTLKRVDTGAVVASTTTDGAGQWRFDDLSPAQLYQAEINSGVGTPPQVAIKKCFSGDVFSLYVREKLTIAPAAIVSFPTAANVYLAGTALLPSFDARYDARYEPLDSAYTKAEADSRYVNVTGDTMSGALIVGAGAAGQGGVHLSGSSSFVSVNVQNNGSGAAYWLLGQPNASGAAVGPDGAFAINQLGFPTYLSIRSWDGRTAIGGTATAGATAQLEVQPTAAGFTPLAVRAHATASNATPHLVTYTQTGVLAMGFNRYGLVVGSSVRDTGITPGPKKALIQVYDETGTFYGYITITS